MAGCFSVKTESEIKPIHITMDVILKVDKALEIIAEHSRRRVETVPSTTTYGLGMTTPIPLEVSVGGATVFVIDVDRFEKL